MVDLEQRLDEALAHAREAENEIARGEAEDAVLSLRYAVEGVSDVVRTLSARIQTLSEGLARFEPDA